LMLAMRSSTRVLIRGRGASLIPPHERHAAKFPCASSVLLSKRFCTATGEDVVVVDDIMASTSVSLKPREVVAELDRHIVGQQAAKKAVANALRNRWRRMQIDSPLREEILPKNILMIGPTGVGKTEVARRLAKLANAPFIKVEATKYTEVGFHGKDVDSIVRDLVETAISMVKATVRERSKAKVLEAVEERILDGLVGAKAGSSLDSRESFRALLRDGSLDERMVTLNLPVPNQNARDPGQLQIAPEIMLTLKRHLGQQQQNTERRKLKVKECRPILEDDEISKLYNQDQIIKMAVDSVERDGIVFIDEIDKIARSKTVYQGADASAEGVQRDLLPIIEGAVVSTKHGPVNTDHILFIACGAFHSVKPSDLLAELQGRLPIRVELQALNQDDLYRILREPEANLITQQVALMKTEGVELNFSDEALREIARVAAEVNSTVENIGARRLHTIIERIIEDISFEASDNSGNVQEISAEYVRDRVGELLKKTDLMKFVL